MAGTRGTLGIQRQQFGRGVAHLLGRLALGLFPLARAEAVQLDRFGVGAGVAGDQMKLRDRHVELVRTRVFEVQELGVALAEVHVHQTEIATDAMARMHHRVARPKLRQIAQPAFGCGLATGVASSSGAGGGGVKLGLGDDRDAGLGQHEAVGERADAQREAFARGQKAGEVGNRRWLETVLGEVFGHGLAPASGFCKHQHTPFEAVEHPLELLQRVARLALDGERGQRPGRHVAGDAAPDLQARSRFQRDEESLVGEEEFGRREYRAGAIAAKEFVARTGVTPEIGQCRRHVLVQYHRDVRGQIVEERGCLVEEKRQVVLDAGRHDPVRNVLVNRRA